MLQSQPGEGLTNQKTRQTFHKISTAQGPYSLALKPLRCKSLKSKYLCQIETLRQVQENNTTFTFWLLPRRIPSVFPEKVRESTSSG
jgi:hypothetical protein